MRKFLVILVLGIVYLNSIESQFPNQITTDDCDKAYGCLRKPQNCVNENCNYVIKWKDAGDSTDFVMGTKDSELKNSYLAIGFSLDQRMGDDCVVICKHNLNGTFHVEHYFNLGYRPQILKSDEPSVGLSNGSVKYQQNFLVCSYRRKKSVEKIDNYYDLNKQYYLLVARGALRPDNYAPNKHDDTKFFSSEMIDFKKTAEITTSSNPLKLAKAHGIFMIFAWLFLSTIGILFARYYKYLYPERMFLGVQFWFVIHRPVMVLVPILSLIGLFLVLAARGWTWVPKEVKTNFAHSIIGIMTISFSFLQPILAIFRPDKNDANRYIFNWGHRLFGLLIYSLSITSIFLGLVIFFQSDNWGVVIGWVFWIFILVCLLELIELWIRNNGKNEVYEKFKSFLMAVHLFISTTFLITMIILISIENKN